MSQTQAAVDQNCMALNYLLTEKSRVCGKFNMPKCCLQIDNKEAVTQLAEDIKQLAHVPVQK